MTLPLDYVYMYSQTFKNNKSLVQPAIVNKSERLRFATPDSESNSDRVTYSRGFTVRQISSLLSSLSCPGARRQLV